MNWSPMKSTVTFETSWGLHLCLSTCDPDAVAGRSGCLSAEVHVHLLHASDK